MVKSGRIEIFTKKEDKEISIAVLGAGNFVGEMSLIDNEPRSASARIAEDAMLMVLNKKCLQNIIATNPEGGNKILMVLLRILCQRLRETNSKLSLS
ncbi:Crp/Fnr family transcriptional regulator [bacterium]|nr:Crp/Fnr family transcriptional regulator [bacterium]